MLDKRDAVLAKLAKSLGLADDAGLARALQLKKRAQGRSLDLLLVDAGVIDKAQRNQLVRAFNDKLRAHRESKDADAKKRSSSSHLARDRGIEDSGILGADDSDDAPLPPAPPDFASRTEETIIGPEAFDAPPVPPADVQREARAAGSSRFATYDGPFDLKEEGARIRNPGSDIQHLGEEESPLARKSSGSGRTDAPPPSASASGASAEDDLEVPEDEDALLAEPTLLLKDEDAQAMAAQDAEDKILSEPTIILEDEKPRPSPASTDDGDTLRSPAKPPPSPEPDDPEIRLASQSGRQREGPRPGVKPKKGGVLDREEFKRRTKLRLGFDGMTLGDYEVLGEIARGAFGVVLRARPGGMAKALARERGFEGDVAMKVMLERKDPAETRRFMDEVKVLIGLDHPNIIRIFDAGTELGLTYYTMELVNGIDTRTLVRQQGVPPLLLAVRIAKDVATALATVHAQTLYHRDIKPTNVLIDRSTQPYRTVLIDFGLVQRKGKDEGLVMGTPSYMPPEQAKPKGGFGEANATSDIYSLGATFYFLLSGQPPFAGNDPKEIIRRVVSEPPPDPCSIKPEIPRRIADICLKCLMKGQRERYNAARLLADDLERELKSAQLKLKAKSVWGKLFGTGGKQA